MVKFIYFENSEAEVLRLLSGSASLLAGLVGLWEMELASERALSTERCDGVRTLGEVDIDQRVADYNNNMLSFLMHNMCGDLETDGAEQVVLEPLAVM